MSEKPPIIDAEFEVVRGPDQKIDNATLAAMLKEKGIGYDELCRIFADAGHPAFLPGGRYYRRPRKTLFQWFQLACLAFCIGGLPFVVWDMASDGKPSADWGRWMKEHNLVSSQEPAWAQVLDFVRAQSRGEPYQPRQ